VRAGRTPTHGRDIEQRALRLLRRLAGRQTVAGAVLCSVVPALNSAWEAALDQAFDLRPMRVSHRVALGIRLRYPRPATIGGDRLANACAAWHRWHAPAVILDFGTALTFDVVSGDGAYLGGVIAPGLPLMTDYLAERTALLPRIGLKGYCRDIGRSTVEAMRIGALIGYRGLVREILAHVLKRLPRHTIVCATGGYAAKTLTHLTPAVQVLPRLTLEGLAIIHELNRGKGRAKTDA
jgi:type III pantothenate kinase